MHDFFVVADALAFCATPILLIIFIVQLIRKKPAKKWGIASAVFFILFCVFGIGGAITGCQHEWNLVNTVEATCTEDGTEIYHCALCDMDKTNKLKALGHDMVDISHRDATTEKEGEDVRVCSRCGYEEISTIPMLKQLECSHDWEAATCTTPKTCAKCGEARGTALGHNMLEISRVEATTASEGEIVKKCSRCSYEEKTVIPKATCSHEWKEATCTTPKTCSKCMETIGKALGHDWKDATLDEAKTCLRCGLTQGEPLSKDSGSEISSSYDGKTCADCGKPAKYTYTTIGTGVTRYYCEEHYFEIINWLSESLGSGESKGSSDTSNSTTGNATSTPDRNYARHSDEDAWVCAKKIVKDNLKSPSSAKFCKMKDAAITHLGNGEYQVEGWVEAENSFGAKIRNNFIVNYTATSEGFKNGSVIFF